MLAEEELIDLKHENEVHLRGGSSIETGRKETMNYSEGDKNINSDSGVQLTYVNRGSMILIRLIKTYNHDQT